MYKRMLVIALGVLFLTSIEAFTMPGDCSAFWNEHSKNNISGAIRLRLLHHQHPCSSGRYRQADASLLWQRSKSLKRDRQFAARLFFRHRHVLPTEISAPVTGNRVFHGFVAQIAIGTPPTKQNMLVDTAGSFSWVQCEPCSRTARATATSRCFDQDGPRFNPGASTTYRKMLCSSPSCVLVHGNTSAAGHCFDEENRCGYYINYMDGSVSTGRMGTDTLTFGDAAIPGIVFGCSHDYKGVFGRYSGILSFSTDKLSFFSQVLERTGQYRAFSYYLPSPSSVGYIQVGAYDEGGLEFTPMFPRGSDHIIALAGITVDGCLLELPEKSWRSPKPLAVPCYLDLGTEFSVLPNKTLEKLNDAVAERIKGYDPVQGWPGCFEPAYLSTERVIPAVQMQFASGVRLQLDEQKLMYKSQDGMLCLGFASSRDYYVLGSMQMQMIYAVQDIEKSRMGFSSRN